MAGDQIGAEAQQQAILFVDGSGFSPSPHVVRTSAPIGQTPVLRECCTRDHLSAISAVSPEGKLYFHSQEHPINSDGVIAFLEHLLREVSGRLVLIWDGHRSTVATRSRNSWPMAPPNASAWNACRPMRRS
jgi:DDE superfamily endonuclease